VSEAGRHDPQSLPRRHAEGVRAARPLHQRPVSALRCRPYVALVPRTGLTLGGTHPNGRRASAYEADAFPLYTIFAEFQYLSRELHRQPRTLTVYSHGIERR